MARSGSASLRRAGEVVEHQVVRGQKGYQDHRNEFKKKVLSANRFTHGRHSMRF